MNLLDWHRAARECDVRLVKIVPAVTDPYATIHLGHTLIAVGVNRVVVWRVDALRSGEYLRRLGEVASATAAPLTPIEILHAALRMRAAQS